MMRTLLVPAMIAMFPLWCCPGDVGAADAVKKPQPQVSYLLTKVRILPKAGAAALLAGARITGSNLSSMNAFVELARIDKAPAEGQWLDVAVPAAAVYRWVKLEAAAGSGLAVAELEFHGATGKLAGAPFATVPAGGSQVDVLKAAKLAFDGDAATAYETTALGAYVGLRLSDQCQTPAPGFRPGGGAYLKPVQVRFETGQSDPTIKIRYTTDGSTPSRTHGKLFPLRPQWWLSPPIEVAASASLAAVAFQAGKAESPITIATYRIGPNQTLAKSIKSYHIGNSLTDTVKGKLDAVAASGGKNLLTYFKTVPGCSIGYNWASSGKGFPYPGSLPGHPDGWTTRYEEVLAEKVDHLFLQPYHNWGGLTRDTADGGKFIQLARRHNPDVQAWLYAQWVFYPGIDKNGKVYADYCSQDFDDGKPEAWAPPLPRNRVKTWDDAMVNATDYYRTLLKAWNRVPGGKPVRLCPGGSALVRLEKEIAAGKVPGAGNFQDFTFVDYAHLTPGAAYLVTLVHYACIFGESPEGKVTWAISGLSPEQARALQRIAWETVVNDPDSGVTLAKHEVRQKAD